MNPTGDVAGDLKRFARFLHQGDDFTVHEGAGQELFTGFGDMRELVCEKVSSPRPERYSPSNLSRRDSGSRQI